MRKNSQLSLHWLLIVSVAGTAVLILANLAASFFLPTVSQPHLVIEKTQVDFGKLEEGEKRTAKFSIFNSGKGLLTVDRVEPG